MPRKPGAADHAGTRHPPRPAPRQRPAHDDAAMPKETSHAFA